MQDVFSVMTATWPPAETRMEGGFILRRGFGGGSRVSAASLHGAPEAADIAGAAAAMRGWDQWPLFLVRATDGALDARLGALGYVVKDPCRILAAPVSRLAPEGPDPRAIPCEAPLAAMTEIWEAAGIGAARRAVMDRAAGPKVWLLARDGDRPAGAAFVAVHDGVAMLHALEIAPAARRRGLGAGLTRAAARWAGREAAADRIALAVTVGNSSATALYLRLGLQETSRYHYRIAPED